jgi:hypothetical protein
MTIFINDPLYLGYSIPIFPMWVMGVTIIAKYMFIQMRLNLKQLISHSLVMNEIHLSELLVHLAAAALIFLYKWL